jgi:2-amino-4-hydroxy-6-hydroxymethyldihydropteridine diphosphokinase
MQRAAYIALGSNLGDSRRILREAIERLAPLSISAPVVSSFWRTAPVDCPPGSPDFLNAAVRIEPPPTTTPETLLEALQALEREFGRRPKKVLNEARPLDLDLIAFGETRMETPTLTLPHPRVPQRAFVLAPLAEIEPALILPGQTETVAALWREFQACGEVGGIRKEA